MQYHTTNSNTFVVMFLVSIIHFLLDSLIDLWWMLINFCHGVLHIYEKLSSFFELITKMNKTWEYHIMIIKRRMNFPVRFIVIAVFPHKTVDSVQLSSVLNVIDMTETCEGEIYLCGWIISSVLWRPSTHIGVCSSVCQLSVVNCNSLFAHQWSRCCI